MPLTEAGVEPRRALPGDVGYDLFVSERVDVAPYGYAQVPTSVVIELPARIWGMLVPRSSALRRGLHGMTGIIDNGYRGEMFGGVFNLTPETICIMPGERIFQLILMPMTTLPLEQVASLSPSERGAVGFGSTGR